MKKFKYVGITMTSGMLKAMALCGTTVAGGGMIAGTYAFSNSKDKKAIPIKNEVVPPKKETETPKEPVCVIYEAKAPEGGNFSSLLKKFETKEEFFKSLVNDRKTENESKFKEDIDKACESKDGKKNVDGNVYVYEQKDGGKNSWVYSTGMNEKNWINEVGIKKFWGERAK